MSNYTRTPLPHSVRRVSTEVLCAMLILWSPFVSIALDGMYGISSWLPSYISVGLGVLGLLLRSKHYKNAVPKQTRDEYKYGKLLKASEYVCSLQLPSMPCVFALAKRKQAKKTLTIDANGLYFTPNAVVQVTLKLAKKFSQHRYLSDVTGGAGIESHFLKWSEILEWQVHDGDEMANYYKLCLADKQYILIERTSPSESETRLLDSVRGIGHVDVRIFCDIKA
jgi:hypothetical protein